MNAPTGDLAWLSDTRAALIIADKTWRQKQAQLRALPMWFYEPTDEVKAFLERWRSGDEVEADDPIWRDVNDHLRDDFIAFLWFFTLYKNRDTRRRERATPTPPQLAFAWRLMYVVDSGEPVRIDILKTRQSGFSWIVCQAIYWFIGFRENLQSLIVSHEKPTTQRIFQYMKETWEQLPDEIRPARDTANRNELWLRNKDEAARRDGDPGLDSKGIVDTAGKDFAGSGDAIQVVLADEVGKWDKVCDPETVYTSMVNAVQDEIGTAIFRASTACGAGTFWHSEWKASMKIGKEGWNGHTPCFFPWYFDERNAKKAPPDMELGDQEDSEFGNEVFLKDLYDLDNDQLEWRRRTIMKQVDESRHDLFNQEHPGSPDVAWLFAHGRWIEAPLINIQTARLQEEKRKGLLRLQWEGDLAPLRDVGIDTDIQMEHDEERGLFVPSGLSASSMFRARRHGCLNIYRWPDWRQDYVLGGDVSEGIDGGDSSCLKIFQRVGYSSDMGRNMRLAAEWFGLVDDDVLADLMWRLGWFYSTGRGRLRTPARLVWERTGPGRGVAKWLRIGRDRSVGDSYPPSRMYRRREPDRARGFLPDAHYGVSTNTSTKPVIMGELKKALREGQIQLTDEDMMELGTVTKDDRGRIETNGRDRVMSAALANYGTLFDIPLEGKEEKKEGELEPHSVKWALAMSSRARLAEHDEDEIVTG